MSLFVDTSVWYAAVDAGDAGNERARTILAEDEDLVTTGHVLIESWRLIRARIHARAAESFWGGLRAGVAVIQPVLAADLEVAWEIGRAFEDQGFSVVDRTSFAVMRRLGIHRVAAFDDDFAVYRYGRGKQKSFDVVR